MTHYESMHHVRNNRQKTAQKGDPIISEDGTAILAHFAKDITLPNGALVMQNLVDIRPYSPAFFSGEADIIRAWIEPVFYWPVMRIWRMSTNPASAFDPADERARHEWFRDREMFTVNDKIARIADAIDTALTDRTVQGLVCMGGFCADNDLRSYARVLRNRK